MSARVVRVRAPGKVNLQLSVGPAGADGFHPLATVFQAVDLYESVTASVRDDEQITLTVEAVPALAASTAAIPLDQSNLAWQAALAVRERFGIDAGVDLHILKGVPVAGGMAGGSADAAAAVVACAQAWDCGASRADLHDVCTTLGSDVPFALQGHTAVGLGRGDQLSPAITRGEYHWVFAVRHEGLSTPAVFREFDRLSELDGTPPTEPALDAAIMRALSLGDAVALGAALRNDLQRAALSLAPDLEATMDAMRDADALGVIVSGSGPTVAGLARSRQHALAIAAHVSALRRADATFCASGPATGAVILDEV
jgi:4-diphosphocytidyl-2-C-methyl-D-erythritol kinase